MGPFVILLFCTCVSGWNVAMSSSIIVKPYIVSGVFESLTDIY